MRAPSLRTMGLWNVAEDRRDNVVLRRIRPNALLLRLLLPCLLIFGGAGAALAQSCEEPVGSVHRGPFLLALSLRP